MRQAALRESGCRFQAAMMAVWASRDRMCIVLAAADQDTVDYLSLSALKLVTQICSGQLGCVMRWGISRRFAIVLAPKSGSLAPLWVKAVLSSVWAA